jgi:hypothetical protein
MSICEEENCNYYIWHTMWWFDCKLFQDFNLCGCISTLPCKIPIMTIWGMFCIPGYKCFCERKDKKIKYRQFIVYHI